MSGPVRTQDVPATAASSSDIEDRVIEVTEASVSEVGGHTVLRSLPRARRRTVGPWCFVDHLTPSTLAMDIGPHPHMGLQTVTWLVEGEVLHYDSVGSEQLIKPGQLNLMSAGRGVAHAEETPSTYSGGLHGVQLWLAQPERTRHGDPAFEHHAELAQLELPNGVATILVGELDGVRSPTRQDTPTLGAELLLHGRCELPLDPRHEYALLPLDHHLRVDGHDLAADQLAYLGIGHSSVTIEADTQTRMLLIGGEPFEARILMWWNFVARTKDEINEAFAMWQDHGARFGTVASHLPRIDAPLPPWRA